MTGESALPKLGILAGGGPLPRRLAEVCRARGRPFFIVAMRGHAEPSLTDGFPHAWFRLGEAGAVLDRLRQERVAELCLIGSVRRLSLSTLRPDLKTAAFLARVGRRALGDDGLLDAVRGALEAEGFRVVGVQEILADVLAPSGLLVGTAPDDQAQIDIARGLEVARAIGRLDVGQAAVVEQGVVLALEAVEGTDAMLERVRGLERRGPGGVLVKTPKPQQDRRLDLPTVGVTTVERAAAAGLRGIAVEAQGALIVDRAAVTDAADRLGLFIVGVDEPS
ncbi:MAG: LpxI family protein [Inquilinaceae bacterium]